MRRRRCPARPGSLVSGSVPSVPPRRMVSGPWQVAGCSRDGHIAADANRKGRGPSAGASEVRRSSVRQQQDHSGLWHGS